MRTQQHHFPRTEAAVVTAEPAGRLRTDEALKFAECEETIQRGVETFLEVGGALVTIREERLYRERFPSFEDYCQKRWQMTARRARQLCAATEVVKRIQDAEPVKALPPADRVPEYSLNEAGGEARPQLDERIMQVAARFAGRNNVTVVTLRNIFGWGLDEALVVFDAMIDRGIIQNGAVIPVEKIEQGMSTGAGAGAEAENVIDRLARASTDLPRSEREARPFTQLPKEQQAPAWKEFAQKTPTEERTAKAAEAFVAEHTGKKPREVEVEWSRLQPEGDIFNANCPNLRAPEVYTPLPRKNVFEHEGAKWTVAHFVLVDWGQPEKNSAVCHCLVAEQLYQGPDGDAKKRGTLQGYKVELAGARYRLGPETIFKVASRSSPPPEQEEFGLASESVAGVTAGEQVEPRIEGLAKKLYGIGMAAIKSTGRWKEISTEQRTAWFAIAKWHIDEVQSLEDRLAQYEHKIRNWPKSVLSSVPIRPAKAGSVVKTSSTSDSKLFVIVRLPDKGSINKKPRFGPGWGGLAKARRYQTRKEAISCARSWEKVMTLAQASKLLAVR